MDYHCERVNQNGISFIFKISVVLFISLSLSLINSNEPSLVVAHVYFAQLNLSSQSDSLIYLTKNQSNYIVEDAKTSTLLNLHDTDPSMVLTLEQPSLTSSSSSTQP
jgi:hypothetical protein